MECADSADPSPLSTDNDHPPSWKVFAVQSKLTVTPAQLPEVLLNVALVRPVFVWGAPGIGKSSLVRQFAASLGLDCVSLLGTQLAPEDLMGVPRIVNGRSQFCP